MVDTSGNFPPVTLTLLENLPPVSTTPAVPVTKFAAGVADTCRKFATSVVDPGGTPSHSEYLRNFFKKFEMNLILFFGAWGKMIHEKNLKQKIL